MSGHLTEVFVLVSSGHNLAFSTLAAMMSTSFSVSSLPTPANTRTPWPIDEMSWLSMVTDADLTRCKTAIHVSASSQTIIRLVNTFHCEVIRYGSSSFEGMAQLQSCDGVVSALAASARGVPGRDRLNKAFSNHTGGINKPLPASLACDLNKASSDCFFEFVEVF